MKTIDFVYNAEKYCVKNFLNDAELLSRKVWYNSAEKYPSDRKDLSIVKIEGNMATCAFTELDR